MTTPPAGGRDGIDAFLTQARILWGAFLASPILFAGLGFGIRAARPSDPSPDAAPSVLPAVLGLAAVTTLAASFLFRFGYARMARPAPGGGPEDAVTRYRVALILGYALAEAVSILGFVAFILGATPGVLASFLAPSMLALLAQAPRRSEVESLVEASRTGAAPPG